MILVMNRVKREKSYLIGRIKELVTLIRREKGLSKIRVLEEILRISPRLAIKVQILKIKNHKILQHQKAGTFLTILLKIMNIRNLASVGNVKDRIMPSIV